MLGFATAIDAEGVLKNGISVHITRFLMYFSGSTWAGEILRSPRAKHLQIYFQTHVNIGLIRVYYKIVQTLENYRRQLWGVCENTPPLFCFKPIDYSSIGLSPYVLSTGNLNLNYCLNRCKCTCDPRPHRSNKACRTSNSR